MAYVAQDSNAGINYLRKPIADRKYKHLRLMLKACWDHIGTPEHMRFDIDPRMSYSVTQITNYIIDNFNSNTINAAHARVCSSYESKSRGRPSGSRNKAHVIPNSAESASTESVMSILDDIEDEANHAKSIEAATNNGATTNDSAKPNHMLDASEFVTRKDYKENNKRIGDLIYVTAQQVERQRDDNASFYSNVNDTLELFQAELNKRRVVTVEFKPVDMPKIDLGMQHCNFPGLLELCIAAVSNPSEPLNVWLYGPAGTGKTTAAKHISKALEKCFNRAFPFYALSKLSTEFQVLGYQDAGGRYITTMFRKCYEFGGVIILDEIDSWSPHAMTALNGALANGYCAFPDGMIERHPDCVVIAGANTVGAGANLEYVGRLKQDAASLDRFEMMHWPIDEALEAALTNNEAWLRRVRHVRSMVASRGIKDVMITPRAAIKGAARIAAGISFEMAETLFLKRGMTDAQWNMVK